MRTLQDKISNLIESETDFKEQEISKLVFDYIIKHNIGTLDFKENSKKVVCINKQIEYFYYKKDLICSVKLNGLVI